MTVVEGRVPQSNPKAFETAYAALKGRPLPPGLTTSFLTRDSADPGFYRVITVWESREALERMRSNTEVPAAIALFRNVDVEPQFQLHDIPESIS